MTKSDRYANHCVEAIENQSPQHGLAIGEKTDPRSNDFVQSTKPSANSKYTIVPLKFGDSNYTVVKLNKSLSNNVRSFGGKMMHTPSTLSVADKMFMKAGLLKPTMSKRIAVKSMDSNQQSKSTDSCVNDRDPCLLSAAETLLSLNESHTTTFQDKNIEPLRRSKKITKLEEDEIDAITTSSQNEYPVKLPQPTGFYTEENVEFDGTTFIVEADVHMPPARLLSDPTNIDSEMFRQVPLLEIPKENNLQNTNVKPSIAVPSSYDHNYYQAIPSDDPFPTTLKHHQKQQKSSDATLQELPSQQQSNFVQPAPIAVKPTPSEFITSIKTQKRPSKRSKKIRIQSCELIKLPPIGHIIKIPPNSIVPMNPHHITLIQPTTKGAPVRKAPIPKPKLILNGNGAKSHNIPIAPVQMVTNSKVAVAMKVSTDQLADDLEWNSLEMAPQQRVTHSTQNEPKRNSTTVVSTPLKRKNSENVGPVTAAKIQKVEKPVRGVRVTMTEIDSCSTSLNLPEISIELVDMDRGVKKGVSGVNLTITSPQKPNNRSVSDYLKALEGNNVSIFKVPQKPLCKVLDKSMDIFAKNNVEVKRLKN